jgi:hypothetical protein
VGAWGIRPFRRVIILIAQKSSGNIPAARVQRQQSEFVELFQRRFSSRFANSISFIRRLAPSRFQSTGHPCRCRGTGGGDPGSIYRNIVMKYAKATGISAEAISVCVHSMRATAATNALSNEADIAKVQEWLGHANVSTIRLYDRRKSKPEDSPTFHVKYCE